MTSFGETIKNQLNDRQYEAVTTTEGPLLVLAGAGSGKTRVLTYRAAYLIAERHISPFNVLAVTFTNKAAGEMKTRMESLIGPVTRDMQVSTFHSFCVRILRRFGETVKLPRDFTIYDEEDSLNLIKRAMEDLHVSPKTHAPRAIKSMISSAKDLLIGPEEYATTAKAYFNQVVAKVYDRYQAKLERAASVDFDDLLFKSVIMLKENPDVLDLLQNKYKYIMVDEYQDTNHTQYLLVKYLASRDKNICVVGDDDQSIYGWRGADIRNILDFEKDFPGCAVVKLEQNYRSTRNILHAASSVVKNNRSRKGKTLFSDGEEGDKITLLVADTDRDEAELVADRIESLISENKAKRREIAILYRTNAQSRALEETLKNRFIPYTIVGGLRFYQRKEIKDVLAYLKLLANPNDVISLRRVVNFPTRGIGDKAQSVIEARSSELGIAPADMILGTDDYSFLKGRAKSGLKEFAGILRELRTAKAEKAPVEVVNFAITKTGILREIEAGDPIEADTRKENLDELLAAVDEFCQQQEDATLDSFLEEIALYTDIDQWDDSSDSVTLMTLHAAKGLEFPVVFITGLEEGLFPLSKALETEKELEEERRLFYVGITRAEKWLFVSYARTRRRFGETLTLESRFVDELPDELIQREEPYFSSASSRTSRFAGKTSTELSVEIAADDDDSYAELQVGRWVNHPTWGEGRIMARRGISDAAEVEVLFRLGGRKKLLAKFAHLQILK